MSPKLLLPSVSRCEEMLTLKGVGPERLVAPGLLAGEQPGTPTLTSEHFQPQRYLVFTLCLLWYDDALEGIVFY